MTDIGHSAFALQNVRQARIERADLAGLAGEEDENQDEGEETGSVPKYPRSMLRFQLSDGATVLEAIEYRKIPELELGVTPLGYKVRSLNFEESPFKSISGAAERAVPRTPCSFVLRCS